MKLHARLQSMQPYLSHLSHSHCCLTELHTQFYCYLTLTVSLSYTHTHCLTLTISLSYTHSHCLTFTAVSLLLLSHWARHTVSLLSHSHCLIELHTHTHTLSHSYCLTELHTLTLSHIHCCLTFTVLLSCTHSHCLTAVSYTVLSASFTIAFSMCVCVSL